MTGLTHTQAKQLLNSAADKCLDPINRSVLQGHLSQCPGCRAYAAELDWLNGAVGRGLRARWSAPRRSPIDMAARVRQRLRTDAKLHLVLGVAQALVKLGSLAMVIVVATSLLRGPGDTRHVPVAGGGTSSFVSGVPRFELETADDNPAIARVTSDDDSGNMPASPANRLRVLQY